MVKRTNLYHLLRNIDGELTLISTTHFTKIFTNYLLHFACYNDKQYRLPHAFSNNYYFSVIECDNLKNSRYKFLRE